MTAPADDDAPRLSTGVQIPLERIDELLGVVYEEIYLAEARRRGRVDEEVLYPIVGRELEFVVEQLTEDQAKRLLVPTLMSLFHAHSVLVRRRALEANRRDRGPERRGRGNGDRGPGAG